MKDIDILIKSNEKIVYKVINGLKYIPKNVETEDLVQVGRISLWTALDTYKENSNYSLITHCYKIIYSDIIDWLRKQQSKKNNNSDVMFDNNTSCLEDDVALDMIVIEMNKYITEEDVNILVDKYVNKLTNNELAENYNLCERTICRRIKKAKIILRKKLKWLTN